MRTHHAKAVSLALALAAIGLVSTRAAAVSFVVKDKDFVAGVYEFHYYTFPNTAPAAAAKRTVINGKDQGISDPSLTNSGWEFGDPYSPNIGFWAATGSPGGATKTSGTLTMGWDFSALTGRIAKVEVKTRHYLFQFDPWTEHATGDEIAGFVSTPTSFGTGSFSRLYSYVGTGDKAVAVVGTGSIQDITPFLSSSWLRTPRLLELMFTYSQTPDPTIPARHFNLFRDNAGTGDDGFLLRVTLVPVGISIDEPPHVTAGEPAVFEATASGCDAAPSGWSWSAGGNPTIAGNGTRRAYITWPASGTFSVTTTNSSCAGVSKTESVTIEAGAPQVTVSAAPAGMIQDAEAAGATDAYILVNAGFGSAEVTLTQSGSFFTQSPSSFSIAPGQSQTVTITGVAQPAGVYSGESVATIAGQSAAVRTAIRLLSAQAVSGLVSAAPETNRVDVASPEGTVANGTVAFRNTGSATLTGLLTSSAPWLVPQPGVVSIPAGESATVSFSVNRDLRPISGVGSAVGELALAFRSGGSGAATAAAIVPLETAPINVTKVTVVDTARPVVSSAELSAPAQPVLFLPGVGHVTGTVGLFLSDVAIVNHSPFQSIPSVELLYTRAGGGTTAQKATLGSVGTNVSILFGDLVKSVFEKDGEIGTLQIRAADIDKLSASATILNGSDPKGAYGTAVPVFRSDRAVPANGKMYLTGLRRDGDMHTNLYIQETAGGSVTMDIAFFDSAGASKGNRTETLTPFGLRPLGPVVPEGAVSAILTGAPDSSGRFVAYATPVDRASGDTWSVTDWRQVYGYQPSETLLLIPIAGTAHGAGGTYFRTDVAVMNTGAASTGATLTYYPRGAEAVTRVLTVAPKESRLINDIATTFFGSTTDSIGYVFVAADAGGALAVTSRTYTTVDGKNATFGTGVPTLPGTGAMKAGDVRRIGGLEDSSLASVLAVRPTTFRTNFALIETAGKAAEVRVTVRCVYPSGNVSASITGSRQYSLAPRQLLLLGGLVREVLGPGRETIGDLRNVQIEFAVTAGDGTVEVFTSSVENGTGDAILRVE